MPEGYIIFSGEVRVTGKVGRVPYIYEAPLGGVRKAFLSKLGGKIYFKFKMELLIFVLASESKMPYNVFLLVISI